ncbi:thymidine phosphorylase [Alkalibacter rhizosphaerae]|uniref:Pyrimidine-nucleoside phosphorylase n=1 Tax=Alkalibacter rhizosphaerae TaxID=2815577 RepID=A0A974XEK6_9FIRM|nr:thymidine phosphorylase [Alkalibacter rhizosphaerae]
MNMVDLIVKKRDGHALTPEEVSYIVEAYVKDAIPDYQMSAFLMAVFFQGMSEEETVALTRTMMDSGDQMDLSAIKGVVVDKHSTGGVGDTTTLVLAPWLAACGIPVAKMSGRGLGHTGGTIDKMESIPGFRVELTMEEFVSNVNKIGLALAGQTGSIAPADKKIYALRDVTGTVEQKALIASSIMSKKLASGAGAILLDVKVGSGAFMKNLEDGIALAKSMVDIGNAMGRETKAILSSMDQPLGKAVGNSLEVMEAIKVLQGEEKGDLYYLCLELAKEMMLLSLADMTSKKAEEILLDRLESGKAHDKFLEFVALQGGDVEKLREGLPVGSYRKRLTAENDGYVAKVEASAVGLAAMHLGAGRETKDSIIDLGAGLRIWKRIGDPVAKGELLAELYTNDEDKLLEARNLLKDAFVIEKNQKTTSPLLLGKVDRNGVELWDEDHYRT